MSVAALGTFRPFAAAASLAYATTTCAAHRAESGQPSVQRGNCSSRGKAVFRAV